MPHEPTNSQHAQLSLELERATLYAIGDAWKTLNYTHFRDVLQPPTLAFTDSTRFYARWLCEQHRLEFSLTFVLTQRWTVVLEVLKHEMAHQFVDEVLKIRDETAHGAAFHRVCAERNIDARAAGLPDASEIERHERDAVLSRVAKLLALATSSNEHEAQSAMNAAQRLMLKHNLDILETKRAQQFVSRELGEPAGRLEESVGLIGVVLGEHFFVEVIQLRVWRVREGRMGSVLEATGTSENIAMAEYVYSFLHHTAEMLWMQHKKQHKIRGDRDRRAYRAGVITGFLHKLRDEKKSNQERGLVWVGDPALTSHYRKRYPRISHVNSGGSGSREARSEGQDAGRKLVLHKGVGESSAARGLQLGAGTHKG